MRIFVTGATGLIGSELLPALVAGGANVLALSRRPSPALPSGCRAVPGDPSTAGTWLAAADTCDAVIHLAGENVFARRWNQPFKQRLHDSRVGSTRLIAEQMARAPLTDQGKPRTLITASAIGYYGSRQSEELDEESPPGDDFLARLCRDWEDAAAPARQAGVRVVPVRIGIVLSTKGGGLPKLARPFRFFMGGPIGSGQQWMSWIHIADLVGLIRFALEREDIREPINATAPEPLTNWGFCQTLGRVLRRPSWLATPRWALGFALGEAADVVAGGQRVLPRRAMQWGYSFQFPDLELALRALFWDTNHSGASSRPSIIKAGDSQEGAPRAN